MAINMVKLPTKKDGVNLRVCQGHFATGHSHINYYIDITMQKTRLSEARATAKAICESFRTDTIVDTILCLDNTEVIATCLAEELSKSDFRNMNAHQTIYVISPEFTADGRLLFRENILPMITGKNVLLLAASVVTGSTARAAIEAINYYGGRVSGIGSVFATTDLFEGYRVASIFNPRDLPDYLSYLPGECEMCKQGKRIDALINVHGYSSLE